MCFEDLRCCEIANVRTVKANIGILNPSYLRSNSNVDSCSGWCTRPQTPRSVVTKLAECGSKRHEHKNSDFNIRQEDDGSCLEHLKNWKIRILGQMRGLPQLRPHKSGAPGPDLSIGRHGSLPHSWQRPE